MNFPFILYYFYLFSLPSFHFTPKFNLSFSYHVCARENSKQKRQKWASKQEEEEEQEEEKEQEEENEEEEEGLKLSKNFLLY